MKTKILALLLLFFFSQFLYAVTPSNSTARIIIMEEMQLKGVASGVLVSKDDNFGYVLTANHITWSRNEKTIYYVFFQEDMFAYAALASFNHPRDDMCLLVILKPHTECRPISYRETKIGEKLWQSGWGGKKGRVISNRKIENNDKDIKSLMKLSSQPRLGDSGGPVIDKNGLVVGIISIKGPGYGFAGQLSHAKKWLSSIIGKNPTSFSKLLEASPFTHKDK